MLLCILYDICTLGIARGVGLTGSTLLPSEAEVDVVDFRGAQDKTEVLHRISHVRCNMFVVTTRWQEISSFKTNRS